MKAYGEMETYRHALLIAAVNRGDWWDLRSGRFTPEERLHVTHWVGDWLGPGAGLNAFEKEKTLVPAKNKTPVCWAV